MGWAFKPNISRVLFIGGGGFSGPKKFLRDLPVERVDVVEIDPDVIDAARRYFEVESYPQINIYNQDGRTYLAETKKTYDLIILDAYTKTYVPFHLMTVEFFETLSKKLSPDGVMVSNLISSLVGDTSELFWAEHETVSQVFPSTYVFRTTDSGPGWVQNIILVASKKQNEIQRRDMLVNLESLPEEDAGEQKGHVQNLWERSQKTSSSPILTDNYSPVERLLNPITGRTYEIESESNTRLKENVVTRDIFVVGALLVSMVVLWSILVRPSLRIE